MKKSKEDKRSVIYVPTCKISHKYLVCYSTRISDQPIKRNNYSNFFNDGEKAKTYIGEVSEGSKSRIRNACELLFAITPIKKYKAPSTGKELKFRIGFLTLTLSSGQNEYSDRDIKKNLLEPYLRKLKKYGLKNYVWKAERQQNGNVHFHIFIDCFIDKTDAKNIWNREQSKYHFINDFEKKNGHRDPPSTQIKAVVSNEGLTQYMLKYMLKNSEQEHQGELERDYSERAKGKIWDCSIPLKTPNDTADFITDKEYNGILEAVRIGRLKELKKDYADIFYFNDRKLWQYVPTTIFKRYQLYLEKVRKLSA